MFWAVILYCKKDSVYFFNHCVLLTCVDDGFHVEACLGEQGEIQSGTEDCEMNSFPACGGCGALPLKHLRRSPAILRETASHGVRMWSDSGNGRRSRTRRFGCPGRKGIERLMGRAMQDEWEAWIWGPLHSSP